jgi:hypothetical protein
VKVGFDIISAKQMSTTHRSQGSASTSFPHSVSLSQVWEIPWNL